MIWRAAGRGLAVALACAAFVACAKEQETYQRPSGWVGHCLGRYVVDMPAEVMPARHEPGFLQPSYGFPNQGGLPGGVRYRDIDLIEASQVEVGQFDDRVRAQAFGEHNETVLMGLDQSGKVQRRYQLKAGSHALRVDYPHSFAWRNNERFSFGIWLEADHRPRLLHGKAIGGPESSEIAARTIESLWSRYRPRRSTDIPIDAGVCTPHGFIADLKGQAEHKFNADVLYRSEAQRALVYTISMAPALPEAVGQRLEDLPQPWRETREESKQRREESKAKGEWISVGPGSIVEKYLEPQYLTIAGQRARLSGVKFRPSMDQYDYEVQIETLGDPNDPLKPRIILLAQGLKANYYDGLKGQPPAPPLEQVLPTLMLIAKSVQVRTVRVAKP